MADQYNDNARNTGSVIDDDDPLAELARIIGYDRPAGARPDGEAAPASAAGETGEIDLEAELLGELEPAYVNVGPRPEPDVSAPAARLEGSAPAEGEFAADASIFEDPYGNIDEPDAAAPVAGLPDEPPFDPFSTDEDFATDEMFDEDLGPPLQTSVEDAPDMELDIDLPEEDLYQALEEELTISDEDLSVNLSAEDGPDSLVSDFGDEEAPAEEVSTEPAMTEPPMTEAPAAYTSTEEAFRDELPDEEIDGSDWQAAEIPSAEMVTASDDVTEAGEHDFEDVFAEWDAMVETEFGEPVAPVYPGEEAAEGKQPAEAAGDEDILPPFLGTSPSAVTSYHGDSHDDDILAEMSRFELPVHGEVVAVKTDAAEAENASAYEDAAAHVAAEHHPETGDAGDDAAVATAEENEVFPEPAAADAMNFDSFEAELSADLDDFRTQLESPVVPEVPREEPTDAFPEIEADFDDAADDFLAEEDFDLTIEEFNPADELAEPVAYVDESAEDAPLEDVFAPAEKAEEAETMSFADMTEEPEDVAPESAAETPDDMTAAFSDFLSADAPGSEDAGSSEMELSSDDEAFTFEPTQPAAEDEPFDAFFPQQPVLPAVAVAPMTASAQAEPVAPVEAEEEDDWLASLEAELEEDVAEQEAAHAAAELPEPELPEPEMPYATADDGGDGAFDPSAIVDVDEMPETVAAFDIPDMPGEAAADDDNLESFFESELDREFADLVEAETNEDVTSANAGWYAAPADAKVAEETYSDFENDLGFAGPAETGYRPHPMPVDADAPVAVGEHDDADDGRRKPLIAGLVLGVALLLGGVVFAWSWISGGVTGDGTPKIIMADKDPVKVAPENPGGAKVPNQDKAVYEKVEGNESGQASQPRLVDSAEEPVDVVQRTIDPDMLPLEGRGEAETTDEIGKVEDRLTEGDTETAASANNSEPMLSPRRVRTMIVRPDGTIVARPQEEPAPTEAASAASETPATDAAPAATPTEAAAADPAADAAPAATEPATAGQVADATQETATTAEDQSLAPVRSVTTVPIRQAPVPTSRPADQPVNVVGRVSGNGNVSEVAAADPAAAAPAAAPAQQTQTAQAAAPANPGGYYMQIASQPSAEGAQASYQNLSRRFASVIGGRGVDIQRADIPNKGVYHRVRIPAGTREEANALCARYKSAGGSCLVTR